MSRDPPPSRDYQSGPTLCLHCLEVRDAGGVGIRAEFVLLRVGRTEDPVAKEVHCKDGKDAERAEVDGVQCQVAGLDGVCYWQPGQVTKDQHVAKAVGGDVHGGEHRGLVDVAVKDIPELEDVGEDDGIGEVAIGAVLVGARREVEDDPQGEAWAEFAEGLEVEIREKGVSRVEFAANEPVVERIARLTASRKQRGRLAVGVDVQEGREGDTKEVKGGHKVEVVIPQVDPANPVCATEKKRACHAQSKDGG